MAFCVYVAFDVMTINTEQILNKFLEYLLQNGYTSAAIGNVISAVKSKLQAFGLNVSQWNSHRIMYFNKATLQNRVLK